MRRGSTRVRDEVAFCSLNSTAYFHSLRTVYNPELVSDLLCLLSRAAWSEECARLSQRPTLFLSLSQTAPIVDLYLVLGKETRDTIHEQKQP